MQRDDDGWWRTTVDVAPDTRYGFVLDDDTGTVLPDPRSPRQPEGVHEPSQLHVLDESKWTDRNWTGRQLTGSIIYEMHVGTFTPEGTLDSAIDRLDELVDLGVEFVEPMPLNAFNGTHGWGYDGVLWYAVHEPYGGPDALQRFVDAAHARGLAVVLDVVYNHLGPSGNYLGRFGPYLSAAPGIWGDNINLDGPGSGEVRRYILDNALRWFREFHIDALRLDAVHALIDHTATHLLEELSVETFRLSAHLGRPLSLIAESDLNDPKLITPRPGGGYGLHAQWADDVHHAIHAAVSGERQGYYGDFGSLDCLAYTLGHGFFHAGTYSSFRGRVHGRPLDTRRTPASGLVAYTCTHDQVGNRALGDRPAAHDDAGGLAVRAALVLLSPFTPLVFMGEEWGAGTPWQFFTDHPEPELAAAVREGRTHEFGGHGWTDLYGGPVDVPDPQDPATFAASVLDWSEPTRPDHARLLEWHRVLIALRRTVPDLASGDRHGTSLDVHEVAADPHGRDVQGVPGWQGALVLHRGDARVVLNLAHRPVAVPVPVSRPVRVVAAWDGGTVHTPDGTDEPLVVDVPARSVVVLA